MYDGGVTRPKTIIYFEWIIFGTLLLGVLQVYLSWDRIKAFGNPPDRDLQAVIYLIVLIVMSALVGTLTLLVSRRRSKIAMWVSVAMAAYGIWLVVSGIVHERQLGSNIIPALQCVGQAVAYGLLFTPSARRWMRREDEKEREVASSGAPQHFT
jgi:drug/metabolite transporter (DMT)-like permease